MRVSVASEVVPARGPIRWHQQRGEQVQHRATQSVHAWGPVRDQRRILATVRRLRVVVTAFHFERESSFANGVDVLSPRGGAQ